jgi:elongation factor Ts
MAVIDAKTVNSLREKTGAGMMDCKKALVETEGDFDKAIEILRKKGMASAEKRAGRAAKDGCIGLHISADAKTAVLMELNCETDFVASTEQFQSLLKELLTEAVDNKFTSKDQFQKEKITEFIAKLGENTTVGNLYRFERNGSGFIGSYLHPSPKPGIFKLGVLVELETATDVNPDDEKLKTLVNRDAVPEEVLQKEKEIYMEQAKQEGKPEKILEKIAVGKLEKFYSMGCLVDQLFIKDDKITVGQLIANVSKEIDNPIKVVKFARIKVGEAV